MGPCRSKRINCCKRVWMVLNARTLCAVFGATWAMIYGLNRADEVGRTAPGVIWR